MFTLPDYILDNAVLNHLEGTSSLSSVKVNGMEIPVVDGKWRSSFTDGDITISDPDRSVMLHNLRNGLVILAAGQSNMEWPVRDSLNREEILRRLQGKDITWLQVPRILYPGCPTDERMEWTRLDSSNIDNVSTVGLLAALEVAERTDAPIGLAGLYKGGSSAASWVSLADLESDPALKQFYVTDYWADIQDQTDEQEDEAVAAFDRQVQEYNDGFAAYDKAHPELTRAQKKDLFGHTPFPGPKGKKDFLRPAGLYDTMMVRLCDLEPEIMLWYQGEEDTKFAQGYQSLLKLLLARYRENLNKPDLPVVIAQLPGYREYVPEKHWGLLRLAQQAVADDDPFSEIVCLLDAGDHENIHPQDKEIPGRRMGRMAAKLLGLGDYVDGPKAVCQKGRQVYFDRLLENGTDHLEWSGNYGLEDDPDVLIRSADGIPAFPFNAESLRRKDNSKED